MSEKKTFIEHYAIVKDIDSGDQEAVSRLFAEDGDLAEIKARMNNYAQRCGILAMNNNTLEVEYGGTTGRTVEAEKGEDNKYQVAKELTAATIDITKYFKFG